MSRKSNQVNSTPQPPTEQAEQPSTPADHSASANPSGSTNPFVGSNSSFVPVSTTPLFSTSYRGSGITGTPNNLYIPAEVYEPGRGPFEQAPLIPMPSFGQRDNPFRERSIFSRERSSLYLYQPAHEDNNVQNLHKEKVLASSDQWRLMLDWEIGVLRQRKYEVLLRLSNKNAAIAACQAKIKRLSSKIEEIAIRRTTIRSMLNRQQELANEIRQKNDQILSNGNRGFRNWYKLFLEEYPQGVKTIQNCMQQLAVDKRNARRELAQEKTKEVLLEREKTLITEQEKQLQDSIGNIQKMLMMNLFLTNMVKDDLGDERLVVDDDDLPLDSAYE